MKLSLRTIVPLLVVAALTVACNPFTYKNTPTVTPIQYPQDPRFSVFTYDTADELKVEERVDVFNTHMLKLGAITGHVVVTYFRDGASRMSTPDRQFWVTGVAEVPDTTITVLVDDNISASSLLPGIHPSLCEYMPEGYAFTTVNPAVANKVLGTDPEAIYSEWGSFETREFVVSVDCNLIIITGDGPDAWYQYSGHS